MGWADQGTLPWQSTLMAESAKLAYYSLFFALAFRIGLEYRNADDCISTGDDFLHGGEIGELCSIITPKFTKLECVQQAV